MEVVFIQPLGDNCSPDQNQVWEMGSFRDLGWIDDGYRCNKHNTDSLVQIADKSAAYFGSGRSALAAILTHVLRAACIKNRTERRCYVPSYYCPDVWDTLRRFGLKLVAYSKTPFCDTVAPDGIRQGDLFLNVNLFGAFDPMLSDQASDAGAIVIEDHTHDPFSPFALRPTSHLAFSSLRKALPLPDGGIIYRASKPMRENVGMHQGFTSSSVDPRIVAESAMIMKARYLAGDASIEKEEFLTAFQHVETILTNTSRPTFEMSQRSYELLHRASVTQWRTRQRHNHEVLRRRLTETELQTLVPGDKSVFGVFVACPSRLSATILRTTLVRHNIFAARLWLLPDDDATNATARELAERSLFLHCDERYSTDDMKYAARIILKALA